jgi:ubiquinone/menaquinone biosynthesis C-methylase UbiE
MNQLPNLDHLLQTDWANIELPDAWPDQLNWKMPWVHLRVFFKILGNKHERVRLPDGLIGADMLPKYMLQEFHNLPNGNYSKNLTKGYAKGFEDSMIGTLKQGRERLTQALGKAQRVLDVGSGAGNMAAALKTAGTAEVWALEPSPYLLQRAAITHRDLNIHWQQALAEKTGMPDASFDGISACFLQHEIPPRYLREALAEFQRVVRTGGTLAILEPSDVQWYGSYRQMWRDYGLRGVYFKWLARKAHEPFVLAWHKQNVAELFAEYGFQVHTDDRGCPFRFIVAERT